MVKDSSDKQNVHIPEKKIPMKCIHATRERILASVKIVKDRRDPVGKRSDILWRCGVFSS